MNSPDKTLVDRWSKLQGASVSISALLNDAPSLLSPARDCVAIALRVGDREGNRDSLGANGHRDSSMKVQFVS